MNDITKARHFLKTRGSGMQHLTSFGLMFATAEQQYREIKIRQQVNQEGPGALDEKEVEASVDYATLKYLKRHNRLPPNVASLFKQGITLEEKRNLAQQWAAAW